MTIKIDNTYISKLHWVAEYKDGSRMYQHEGNSKDIDRKNVRKIMLVDINDAAILTQHYRPGYQVLYRSRSISIDNKIVDRIHLLGWIFNDIQHISYVFEHDLRIENSSFVPYAHFTDQPWFYAFDLKEYDLIKVE